MQRIKLLGVAFMAVIALSAITAAMAQAENTKMLPEPTEAAPVTFTGSSGAGTLETTGKETIKCTKDSSTGSAYSANLGTFVVSFEKCTAKSGLATCTGLNVSTKGTIETKGTFHYWLALRGSTLVDAIVFLPTETHFECEALSIKELILVKGCVAGEMTSGESLTSVVTIKLAQSSAGINEITKVLPQESTEEIECKLTSKIAEKAAEQSSLVTLESILGFKQSGGSVTVLMMN